MLQNTDFFRRKVLHRQNAVALYFNQTVRIIRIINFESGSHTWKQYNVIFGHTVIGTYINDISAIHIQY